MSILRDKISSRSLGPGDRMPSIRSFANTMNAAPSTIVEAYDRLAAEGLIQAKRGSGFYVTNTNLPPMKVAEMGTPRPRNVDPFWVSRQSLDALPGAVQPGCGWLPESWMPAEALRKGLRAIARADDATLTNYANSRGSLKLRRYLLGRFAEEQLPAGPEHLMLTASASQALDLICRFFLRAGDKVLVDDPGYFNFHALLTAHQVKIIGVPMTKDGVDIGKFDEALKQHSPRLYITNSAIQNPTGVTISPQTAYQVLTLAKSHDLTIVEDDTFADFEPVPSPRLAILDGLNNVLRIGGFSKTLSASVRCGYIAARPDWIEGLVDLQVATSFSGPSPVATSLLENVLSGGSYRKHMSEIRAKLDKSRNAAITKLAPFGIEPWTVPRGGFYLWGQFPNGIDTGQIARFCLDRNVVMTPGDVFSPSHTASSFMRFNVAHMDNPLIYEALGDAMTQ